MASSCAAAATTLHASLSSAFISPLPKPAVSTVPVSSVSISPISATLSSSNNAVSPAASDTSVCNRRAATALSAIAGMLYLASPALADIEEEYKVETEKVIAQVRNTLNIEKSDPTRGDAVKALRDTSNQWVAKYRREKRFAGKPSYSNMYSVLNAVSGHYISYGDGAPLPAKRKAQILDEVTTAERALSRGR